MALVRPGYEAVVRDGEITSDGHDGHSSVYSWTARLPRRRFRFEAEPQYLEADGATPAAVRGALLTVQP